MIREIISLSCEQCKRRNYTSTKNRKTKSDKITLKKFCPACRKHTGHKEGKV